jgi:hypothetical protein
VTAEHSPESTRSKVTKELREFGILTAYFWVCFGAIVLLKDSILEAHGLAYLPLGFAIIKAAVTAKFVMLGRLTPIAKRRAGERLVVSIARIAVALFLLLLAMTVIEEVVIAMIHGKPAMEAIATLGGGTVYQMVATSVIMFLILIPYVTFYTVQEMLGEDRLRRVLFERPHLSE